MSQKDDEKQRSESYKTATEPRKIIEVPERFEDLESWMKGDFPKKSPNDLDAYTQPDRDNNTNLVGLHWSGEEYIVSIYPVCDDLSFEEIQCQGEERHARFKDALLRFLLRADGLIKLEGEQ